MHGFIEDGAWDNLLREIRKKRCTPIVGPRVAEHLLGSRAEIAERWADTYKYPLDPKDRSNLRQVAQYVEVKRRRRVLIDELVDYLCRALQERYGDILSEVQREAEPSEQLLNALINEVVINKQKRDPYDPHLILAELKQNIYVTAAFGNLLGSAFAQSKIDHVVEACNWKREREFQSVFDTDPNYNPDENRPLVYHLFGRINECDSLVLTEDDYFDFLISVCTETELIPTKVWKALTDTSLFFVGFRITDWEFRVLLRLISSRESKEKLKDFEHVAVQVDPSADDFKSPETVREYLGNYFGEQLYAVNIYWGEIGDFMRELKAHLDQPSIMPAKAGDRPTAPIKLEQPIDLVYSYAHGDEDLINELDKHLSTLKEKGWIRTWHDRSIRGGEKWEQEINENFDKAKIILLLVSADFLSSDFIRIKELPRAMERHEKNEACVIPVILRECDWEEHIIGQLEALPKSGTAITSWANRDEAFKQVAEGIREVIERMAREDHAV